ncbi:MAG: nitrous oxide reductase accessory protein NosL [Myxococcota bacterium]
MRSTLLVLALLVGACSDSDGTAGSTPLEPAEISDQEGAVCGMIVRDQSAPRGQVIHRDGERSFLCSIGDLLAYLEAPSPHGDPASVLVEVMDPSEDPWETHVGAHPWIPAHDGVYVVGVRQRQIMGPPVLVYRDRGSAERVIAGTDGRVLDYPELVRWWRDQQEH